MKENKFKQLICVLILLGILIYQIYSKDLITGIFLYPMCIGGLIISLITAIRDSKSKQN